MTALTAGWRAKAWERLRRGPWDLLVIGGGITGAGIARVAAQAGLRVALVEQRDFGWGTSSRSSKLVHGGLRYLAHGQIGLVRESVAGREALLRAAPGLVEELGFLMPLYRGASPGRLTLAAGLAAYDLLAGRRTHRRLSREDLALLAPRLRTEAGVGGFRYADAWTDDARLVLRVLADARAAGAATLSYARVEGLLRDASGTVVGAGIRDAAGDGAGVEVRASVVVNATGAAADGLRREVGGAPRIRPLRGSHLFLPHWRLPLAQAITVAHPADRRPVFAYPWESVTIVGTTDVDDEGDPAADPAISADETGYLDEWLRFAFPSTGAGAGDAVAAMAGVRPVVGTGKTDPSAESREHVFWEEDGLVTVTGGKLTTFDAVARDAVGRISRRFDASAEPVGARPASARPGPLDAPPTRTEAARGFDAAAMRRLSGRLGRDLAAAIAAAGPGEEERIPGVADPWLALRWAARAEGVVHLEDLLLRRVRLGIQVAGGGAALLGRVRAIAQPELGWDDARWEAEEAAYRALWRAAHAPGTGGAA